MVKAAAKAALLSIAVVLFMCCETAAQNTVTIESIGIRRESNSAVIELRTSHPGDFQLSRFERGNWINIWSARLESLQKDRRLSLDFSSADMDGLVTHAVQYSNSKRNGVRFYLGPDADLMGSKVECDGELVTITIPQAGGTNGWSDSEEDPQMPGHRPVPPGRNKQTASKGSKNEAAAAAMDAQHSGDAVAGVIDDEAVNSVEAGAQSAALSKSPSGKAETMSVSAGRISDGFLRDLPVAQMMPPRTASEDAVPAQDDAADAGDGGFTIPPAGPDAPGKGRPSAEGPVKKSPISTPQAEFFSPFGSEAQIVVSTNPLTGRASTKDHLTSVRIELFEIINTPLDQALTLLVAPTDYNIIVDSSVGTNMVSLSFKDSQTDLKSALDLLTRTYGLDYMVEANTIVVASKEQVQGQLVEYESMLYVLSYADPISVRDILITTGLIDKGQIEVYAGESEIPEVNDSTVLSASSGVDVNDIKPIETNLSSSPRNAILVRGVPEQLDRVGKAIATLDRRPKIVELEVRVCEANESAMKTLGIRADTQVDFTWDEADNSNEPEDDDIFEAFTLSSFNRSPLAFAATLDAQINSGNVETLAQPVLSNVEGKQAIFFAGESIPYITQPAVATGSNFQPAQVGFTRIGIILNFKSRLDADGMLTIDVNPTVSSLVELVDLGGGAVAPRTLNRQLATLVRVKDGESFVLAGLISKNEQRTMSKVPLLGDLPLVGRLFRSKHTDTERSEIIVIVTPRLID